MPSQKRSRIALLIDGENISPRYAEELVGKTNDLGRVTTRWVFGDFKRKNTPPWNTLLTKALGIYPVQVRRVGMGLNSIDQAIITQAQKLLEGDVVDGFCVASADGHFAPLAEQVREAGRLFFGVGPADSSRKLIQACHRFLSLADTSEGSWKLSDKQRVRLLRLAVSFHVNKKGWSKVRAVALWLRHWSLSYTKNKWGFASATKLLRATGDFEIVIDKQQQAWTRPILVAKSALGNTGSMSCQSTR